MLFDRRTDNGLIVAQNTNGTLQVQTSGGASDFASTSTTLNDNNWHHVGVVFDQSEGGTITIYIDGVNDSQNGGNSKAWSWPSGQQIEIGRSHDSFWQAYNGLLGDIRFLPLYRHPHPHQCRRQSLPDVSPWSGGIGDTDSGAGPFWRATRSRQAGRRPTSQACALNVSQTCG
jgi:hypothetical protein